MRTAIVACLLAACGRIDFTPRDDGGQGASGDGGGDATGDGGASVDAGLLLHFAFESDGLLLERVSGATAACANNCPVSTAGRVGAGAAMFNGNSCATLGDALAAHPASFTFAAWFLVSSLQQQMIFGKPYFATAGTLDTFELGVRNTGSVVAVNGAGGGQQSPTLGIWHHLAGVSSAGNLAVFVDGGLLSNIAAQPMFTTDEFVIGCDVEVGVLNQFLTGAVDDARLYDRALSPAEVAALAAL